MTSIISLLVAFFLLLSTATAQTVTTDLLVHQIARDGAGSQLLQLLKSDPAARDMRTQLGSTPLHFAATNPDRSAMTVLLAAGADPNARDGEGSTPLHMAAYASKAQNVQQLLEAGADPLLKNNAGRDAAAMARKVKADEAAGVISLWMLKGCKAGKPC